MATSSSFTTPSTSCSFPCNDGIHTFMVTETYSRHWLERCSLQDEHWDQTPWPARMIKFDSESEEEEVVEEISLYQRRQQRRQQQKLRQQTKSAEAAAAASKEQVARPSLVSKRGTSYRHYRNKSESNFDDGAALHRFLENRRRHCRVDSAPAPETVSLHIDTVLPLQLPPTNLCTLSPLMTYPTTWWPSSTEIQDGEDDFVRRSASTSSFLSASSNGSWHGDSGDQDPDGQLDDAIIRLTEKNKGKAVMKTEIDSLILNTFDYDEGQDDLSPQYSNSTDKEAVDSEAEEESTIRLLAGPLMNTVAYLLEAKLSFSLFSAEQPVKPTHKKHHSISRSLSDSSFTAPPTSSLSQLDNETNSLRLHRRQRSSTAPLLPLPSQGKSEVANSKLHNLWQWIIPNVDEEMEHELLGYPRSSPRSRTSSIPSLSSGSISSDSDESEDEEEDDDNRLYSSLPLNNPRAGHVYAVEHGTLYDVTLSEKRNLLPRSTIKRRKSLTSPNDIPSPLWDNRCAENNEPYQRSWSSVLGLCSM